MQLDSYAFCPCGSGKKIKFCCSKDLLHELEKVQRALGGEQYVSAQEQTTRLIAEYGERPALLAIQAETQAAMQQIAEAETTARRLLEIMPHSSVGRAILAIAAVIQGNIDEAVDQLQRSIETIENSMHLVTVSAMSIVAQGLMRSGKVLAARGHLLMRAGLSGGKDQEAVESLMELNRMQQMPTMLKQDFVYADCPPGAPWQGEFEAAMKTARRGAWLAACESLESLDQKIPYQQAVVRNIAILRSWLGQDAAACATWRRYVSLPAISEDDAVEAEATCQLLSPGDDDETVDLLRITYPIRDVEKLMESLLSNQRVEAVPEDPNDASEEGQPPPKGVFRLLDRQMPPSDDRLSISDLPKVLGEFLVYGKQTDREAQLIFEVERTERLDEAKSKLLEVAGEWIHPAAGEEVRGQLSAFQLALNPEIRLPRDITNERAIELVDAMRHEIMFKVWPEIRRGIYDGKSAREAARDPRLRNRVSAAILNLELASEEVSARNSIDFNALRRDLGLPEKGTFQVQGRDILRVPMSQWGRVDFAALSDDELLDAFRVVTMKSLRLPMRRCAQVMVSRPSIGEKVELSEVYRLLVSVSIDSDEALAHIDSGRRITATRGESPASWYLLELQVRLSRYEAAECNRLTKLIATRHANEPGVRESLFQILNRYGVISPDGSVRGGGPGQETARPEPAVASAAEPSGLWTPESAAPKQESKLWLPGMQ